MRRTRSSSVPQVPPVVCVCQITEPEEYVSRMAVYPDFGVFPIGTHVYREPCQDQEELMHDLPILKQLGFNMIKIQESWAIDEPAEGVYDFSRIERLISRAGDLGLGVYLGLTMEQAPAWFWQKYPDSHLVYANGLAHNDSTQYCLPADGKPGPCWDNPDARACGERFVAELARRLGGYDNIWAWNTWQEIGFWPNEAGPLGFCYCPHTLSRFQQWLEERYGSLASLNATWATAYSDWRAIDPPRRAAAVPSFIDWRYFMDDVYIPHALDWKTAALKANDPGKRPVFSHVAGAQVGSGAEWRWSRTGDFFGNSNYPAWHAFEAWDDTIVEKDNWHPTALQEMWAAVMFRSDYTRSATGRDRAFWGAEFQGGPISTHLHIGRTPSKEDIRRWMLSGVASGMQGISFWNHRAERFWGECNGFGLLDPMGDTTERIEEAGKVGTALNTHAALFAQGQPPLAQVALLVNEDLYHFSQGTNNQARELLQYNLRGHYARLWRLGIPVDFVDASEVAAGALNQYAAVILPMPLALGGDYVGYLSAYVEQGGVLISDAVPGRFDRYGFCPREQLVDGGETLFGARHQRVQLVGEPDDARWTPPSRGYGEIAAPTILAGIGAYDGQHLRASFYVQTLTPTSGTPILMAGEHVAGVLNHYGKGESVLLGTFSGLCATAHTHPEADDFMARLLTQEAGVHPDTCGALLRRRRNGVGTEAWFMINPHRHEVTETVSLDDFEHVCDLLDDELQASPHSCTLTVAPASIRCLVLSRSTGTDE